MLNFCWYCTMKSKKIFLKNFIVFIYLFSISRKTHGLNSLDPLHDTSYITPNNIQKFTYSRPYTIRGKTLFYEVNASKIFDKIHETPTTTPLSDSTSSRKKHIGRVNLKQYEIVNMLWRRTNVFIDEDTITTTSPTVLNNDQIQSQKRQIDFCKLCTRYSTSTPLPSVLTTFHPVLKLKTPSYIEFYYLAEMDNDSTVNKTVKPNLGHAIHKVNQSSDRPIALPQDVSNHETHTKVTSHVNGRTIWKTDKTGNEMADYGKPMAFYPYMMFKNFIPANITTNTKAIKDISLYVPMTEVVLPEKNKSGSFLNNTFIEDIDKTTTQTVENSTYVFQNNENSVLNIVESSLLTTSYVNIKDYRGTIQNLSTVNSSTSKFYDKIKFFELYDSNTEESLIDENMNRDIGNDINIDQRIDLEHIDQELGLKTSRKPKMIKKHIDASENRDYEEIDSDSTKETTTLVKPEHPKSLKTSSILTNQFTVSSTTLANQFLNFNSSKTASLSEYPFAAVYIYERFQVHCDAGVLSRHWLVAAGSCLSRHREDPVGDRRSAFVTYCSEAWWDPQRINYVKYSLIHPRFSPRDDARKHLYNIGLIQVVSSMASACNNWAPVSLISHQYAASRIGSMASAVGWGLDRYDTRYSTVELPRHPLAVYDSLMFSDTCPGNVGYGRAKHQNEAGMENVYCLTLPPYSTEDDDPIHGGLLLVGGHLIALYLQEERRPWGDQSALYTGIWKLVPWIMDVAREPEEADFMV